MEKFLKMKIYEKATVELIVLVEDDIIRCSNPEDTQPDPFGDIQW